MDKVYRGCMLVDEEELDMLLDAVGGILDRIQHINKDFNELTKLYVKLLKEKEDIQRERAKFEPTTESV